MYGSSICSKSIVASRIALTGALALTTAAIILLSPTNVRGCGGTPPPISCGFAYNMAAGGLFTVVAEPFDQTITLSTYHYLALLGTCPPGPYRVTMFVNVEDQAGLTSGPEEVFGPFDIDSFFDNIITITPTVSAGPVRRARVNVRSELAIIDGRVLEQTASQPVCVVPGTNGTPDYEIVPIGTTASVVRPFAPGGPGAVELEFRNNTDTDYLGHIVVETRNAATPARTIVGNDGVTHGVFSIGDPVGDAFDPYLASQLAGECPPQSDDPPHERVVGTTSRAIEIPAGGSVVETVLFVAPSLCGDGKCDNATISLRRVLASDDNDDDDACTGIVPASDLEQFPTKCHLTRAAFVRRQFVGSNIGIGATPADQPWQVNFIANKALSSFFVNGQPGVANVVSDVVPVVRDQFGRICHDRSFLEPSASPGSIFEMFFRYDLKAHGPFQDDISVEFVEAHVIDGAPTGRPGAPLSHGSFCVNALNGGVESRRGEYLQQASVIFVTETFDLIEGEVLEVEDIDFDDCGYTKRIVARAPEGSTNEPLIGFTAYSDVRTVFGAKFCPADTNGDGFVDIVDLVTLLVEWGPCDGTCVSDLDGSGDVGILDLLLLLGQWGPCDD